MRSILLRWVLSSVALWLTTSLVGGVSFARAGAGPVLITALVMGLVNAFVRPVMVVLTLPLTIMSLGLFLLIVNALLLAIVAVLTPLQIAGFWSALFGALIYSVVNMLLSSFVKPSDKVIVVERT
ncbi:MAG: phage holin family protein [Deinococcota bacterium]